MKYALILLTALLFGCNDYNQAEKNQFDQEIQVYLKKHKLNLTKTASGVYFKVLEMGTGPEIRYNDIIQVIYKGELLDGTVFDQQYSPVEYTLKNLIPAWKEVLVGLPEGTALMMVVPPHMGYGSQDNGDIPSNSALFFDMTVLARR